MCISKWKHKTISQWLQILIFEVTLCTKMTENVGCTYSIFRMPLTVVVSHGTCKQMFLGIAVMMWKILKAWIALKKTWISRNVAQPLFWLWCLPKQIKMTSPLAGSWQLRDSITVFSAQGMDETQQFIIYCTSGTYYICTDGLLVPHQTLYFLFAKQKWFSNIK